MLFGLFIAVLCAGHTISREMKNGTVLLLMSKPVPRVSFVLAKVLGILTALTIFVVICSCATCISVLIAKDQFRLDDPALYTYFAAIAVACLYGGIRNFLSQKSFSSHAAGALLLLFPLITVVLSVIRHFSQDAMGADTIPLGLLLPALLLLFPAVWVMGAVSTALAVKLDFISNLLICLAIFLTGLVSQYFLHAWFGDSVLSGLFGSILPNWQFFWMADALTNMTKIPWSYVVWAVLYVLLQIVVWVFWAVFLFQENELAKDSR